MTFSAEKRVLLTSKRSRLKGPRVATVTNLHDRSRKIHDLEACGTVQVDTKCERIATCSPVDRCNGDRLAEDGERLRASTGTGIAQLLAGRPGVGVRVPVGSMIFRSQRRPHRLWGPPSLLSNTYRVFILWG
jgi:hypothetical protein